MSEWTYIYIAYGLTWATLAVYLVHLLRRGAAATRALRAPDAGREGKR